MSDLTPYQPRSVVRRVLDRVAAWLGYEGARPRRESDGIPVGSSVDPNTLISGSIQGLRDHSHNIIRNHWVGSRGVDVLVAKIVGDGIRPSSLDPQVKELLAKWARPQAQVGARKGQGLAAVQRLAMRTVIASGGAIVVRRPQNRADMRKKGLVVPMVVHVLEPTWLDTSRDDYGIEMGSDGWVERYHLRDPTGWGTDAKAFDARDVSYLMLEQRPGQRIGVPWFAPVMRKQRDYDAYDDAELMRAKIASMFAGFVKTPPNFGTQRDETLTLEPGRIQQLNPGEDMILTEPPSTSGYEAFSRAQLRAIAAGLGNSYEDLTGDYSQVNFSSARMAALVTNKLVGIWRDELLIGLLCADMERWFIDAASLLGVAPADITWTAPAFALIDPNKETDATIKEINAGLTSRHAEIRRRGRDPEEVDAERREDRDAVAPTTTSLSRVA